MKKLLLWLTLVIAAVLRFYNNTAVSLWHDEAFSALYISKYGWGEMMHRIILDVHPPLYYILLRIWSMILGHSLLSLRGFSILFGVLTVWAGYLLVKQAFKSEKVALFAALLIAINPFQIQYALEARMYTFGTFVVLLSSYFLLKALEQPTKKNWIWYGVTVAAAAYTHYFLIFSMVAQALFWFIYCVRTYKLSFFKTKEFLGGLGAYFLSLLLYLPWLPSFIEQNTRVSGGYWIPAPDRWSVPGTIWKMTFGGEGINRTMLLIASIATVFILFYFLRRTVEKTKWLFFLCLSVPILAALGLSLKTAIYQDRYFVFTSLFFAIILAVFIMEIPQFATRRTLATIFVIVSVVTFFKNWQQLDVKNLFFNRAENKKPGMAKAAEIINNNRVKETDPVFVGSSFIFFTFQYYNQSTVSKPLLLSDIPLEQIPHFSGTAILSEDDLQRTENGLVPANAVQKDDNVWLLWTTGFGGSKPNVPGNWSIVDEWPYSDTPGFKGSIVVTQYHVR